MFKTKVGEIPEDVQSLTGRDVPVSALLDLSEDPGLNESSPVGTATSNTDYTSNVKFTY